MNKLQLPQAQALPNGYRHVALDEVSSTNTIALEYSDNGDPGNLWITAECQTQGKGSRGRSWVSQRGNLYASLLLNIDAPAEKLGNLTFIASLALYQTLVKFMPEDRLALKWPNDLLLDKSKISGILLENHVRQNRPSVVIIGMGVNCISHPEQTTHTATNIKTAGFSVEPDTLFSSLVVEMDHWLKVWREGENFTEIRTQWLRRAVGVGQKIRVKTPKGQYDGIFEDLDPNGCLILKTPDNKIQTITVADIFFSNHNS